jgi:hypothetical protein
VLALAIAVVLAARRRSLLFGYVALCLLGLLATAAAHVRFAAYPEAAGAIALPVAVTLAASAMGSWPQIGQSLTRVAMIVTFILVPYLGRSDELAGTAHAMTIQVPPACAAADAAAMLMPYPGEVVLADVNDTPELLYKTRILTVGSLYHRNAAAYARLRAAWRTAPSETVPPEIDAAEISLVLGCLSPQRSALVEDLDRTTLFDQVRTGQPPPWLLRVDEDPRSGHVLYKVVRPAGGG